MRPALTTVEQDAHVAAAAYLMKHAGATALVIRARLTGHPIGIITQADIVHAIAAGKDLNSVRIHDLMTTRPTLISTTTSVRDAAEVMTSGHFRHLPVVGDGDLAGIVDISDICRALIGLGSPDSPAALCSFPASGERPSVTALNKTLAVAYYQAGVVGELPRFAEYVTEDFTITAPAYLPWGGTHRGVASFRQMLAIVPDVLDFARFSYASLTGEGDHVVALINIGVTGTDAVVRFSEHWSFTGGKAASLWTACFEPQALLEKLGLCGTSCTT
jgi:ketosteroid isomerase-like protein